MRIDVPAEDDTPRVPPESYADQAPQSNGRELVDRAAYAANYRSIVDRTYQDYLAATSGAAELQTHAAHVGGTDDADSGGNCRLTVQASDNSENK
jgi:hypothetical protein